MAASAVGGVWFGITRVVDHAGDYLATREALAAVPASAQAPEPLPAARLPVALVAAPAPNNIYGVNDAEVLAPLGQAPVTGIKLNRGGTSLSIRLDFANGTRAAFKPEQTHYQSDPRREIAAFRIDRLLGLGHVPPAKETTVAVKDLLAVAEPGWRQWIAQRLSEEGQIRKGGVLHGELSWWVPEIQLAKLAGVRIDEDRGFTLWTAYLKAGVVIPDEHRPMLEQISKVILFDALIDNADRWSGSNTQMSPDGRLLYFMDNTLAFSTARYGRQMNAWALRRIQVFSRELVRRMRELTLEQLENALVLGSDSKLGRLLKPDEIRAIMYRRDNMMDYIDRLIAKHGEDAVLAFP